MKKTVIRGHHLLCVHGFQGMGYSPDFIEKMSEIVEDMRNEKMDYPIQVVIGLDETCGYCPHKGDGFCNKNDESQQHVIELDQRVTEKLNIKHGDIHQKSQLVALVKQKVEPGDLDVLCEGCSWLEYGVCKQGIARLRSAESLT